jgi:hypothetical protein
MQGRPEHRVFHTASGAVCYEPKPQKRMRLHSQKGLECRSERFGYHHKEGGP